MYERLKRDGRLVEEDPSRNFVGQQTTRDKLRQGDCDLVWRLYPPAAYLERYFEVYESPEYLERRAEICRRARPGEAIAHAGIGTGANVPIAVGVAVGRNAVDGRSRLTVC